MWTYQTRTTILKTFNQELMTPKAKMWMKFICLRIWPTLEMSEIAQFKLS
ncbi:hypothetical protein Goshw_003244 [Gossypium schwendimanii]|uniref:Uncharacterized protein n=1 Tax=Gossypium schwendimanii TaxID=34291 RepID=A0A7J9L7F3_GOSSC|nr:hypothetical protein [Gossypium schwendimanii]